MWASITKENVLESMISTSILLNNYSLSLQLIVYNPVIENLSCSEATGKMPISSIYLKNVSIEVFPPKLLNCGFHLFPWSESTTSKSVIFVPLSN